MTESPFIDGTNIQWAWDSTSLGWLKTCPRLYQLYMIEGWRPRGESVHLRFGIIYHSSLELYDRWRAEGKTHEDALRAATRYALVETWDREEDKPWETHHNLKTRETLIRSVIWYIEKFRDDPAKTVILADGRPAVELSFRMELSWGPGYNPHDPEWRPRSEKPYVLCGHIDRLAEFSGQTYFMDRKTTGSTLSPYYFQGFEPDNQMTTYTLASRVVFGAPVRGGIIDAAQIAVGFTRFERGFTYRTETQLTEWMKDLQIWLTHAESYAIQNYWPMNDKACGMYGGCPMRGICSKSPEVRSRFLEGDYVRSRWNPLEAR